MPNDKASKSNKSCILCAEDDNDEMVCCDKCEGWYHFTCVGVTEAVSEVEWECSSCTALPASMAKEQQGIHLQNKTTLADTAHTQPADLSNCNKSSNKQKGTMYSGRVKSSKVSIKSKRLAEKMKVLEEEESILRQKQEILNKKKTLLKEMESDSDDSGEVEVWSDGKKKNDTIFKGYPDAESTGARDLDEPLEHMGQLDNTAGLTQMRTLLNTMVEKINELQINGNVSRERDLTSQWLPGVISNVSVNSCRSVDTTKEVVKLSREQIASRHSFAKDLPKFSGNPEDWPLFLATFQQTTDVCGFSDSENLLRLRTSLEGDALKSVRNLLFHPTCVTQIIETLRIKFGRPEIVLNILLKRVRDFAPIKENKLESLVDFALEVQNIIATMKSANLKSYLNNPEIEQELVLKLPGIIAAFWGMHKLNLSSCNLENFGSWLFQFAQGANNVLMPDQHSTKPNKRGNVNTHSELNNNKCVVCGLTCTDVSSCEKFKDLSRTKKWEIVRLYRLCRRCLTPHSMAECESSQLCGMENCQFAHHPLLHKHIQGVCNVVGKSEEAVLFRILPVVLYGNGRQIKTYAFFDDGSSLTLMEDSLLRELNLTGTPSPLCLKWTADTHRYEEDSVMLSLQISGDRIKKCFDLNNIHTVKSLNLPRQSLDIHQLKIRYSYLKEIPLSSYRDAEPKLLIGLNNSWLGRSLKSRERAVSDPVAEKTRLGWTLKGPCSYKLNRTALNAFHTCGDTNECDELLQTVKQYILLDNLDVNKPHSKLVAVEDMQGLRQLEENTRRLDNCYETRLLWRASKGTHPDSFPMAKRRAQCLSLKLSKDPTLYASMAEKIQDYLAKGYAIRLPDSVESSECWYLPIFPVINPSKPSKIRIVWDAAAKVRGVSLNSMLVKGPDLNAPLVDVLRRFRQQRYAISGDIKEMYHQVKIHPEDQNYQRFLWYEKGNKEPTKYMLTVMTFGATCSPCAAQYVKNLNAEQFRATYPRAVEAIVDNHYVDDMLDGMDTEEEVLQLAIRVRFIHAQGGFTIRNWRSNSEKTLRALNATETADLNLDVDQAMGPEKVLGMWWVTSEDCFSFKVSQKYRHCEYLNGKCRPTKRQALSIVMSIFDPLGLLGFYVMYAKIILQEVWRSKCSWDECLHDAEYVRWLRWSEHLPEIEQVKIPRYYFHDTHKKINNIELHVFVDASESGYSAVLYIRYSVENDIKCSLVGSKTKVAPLKMLSIPRLELQAALLGARFAKSVTSSSKLNFNRQVFWTDSRTALSWIRSDHRKYSQFVAFRVSEIVETTEVDEWRWIPSGDNVADEATKWQKTPNFSQNSRWFNGPSFLYMPPATWPKESIDNSTVEELRPQYVGFHNQIINNTFAVDPHRFSRWTRFTGATSTLLQAVRIWKAKIRHEKVTYNKTQEDIAHAETMIWRCTQSAVFGDELVLLNRKRPLAPPSTLYKLSGYLDEKGLIRLDSRVQMNGRANPIILPRDHYVTLLLVMNYHVKYLHCNHETVVNEIRQTFWIPRLRSVLKAVRRTCQMCLIQNAKPKPPKMSTLPAPRLAPFCHPFTYVGVDFFGPISVVIRRSSEKRYGALFTCLSTRAVHLEIAYSLSTSSCIIAIRSFVARRGTPREWWSDNGTNLKGASRELREAFELMNKNEIVKTFTTSEMTWNFIPPSSPHMGGAWERLVRSVKTSLASILPRHRLTDELLRAAFIEVENIVNSRPLTYIPIENGEEESLTPNHFIHGNSNGMKPLVPPDEDGVSLRRGWKVAQQIADSFWTRWIREYLPIITRRSKWFQKTKPIEIGDIVYIADPSSPRNCWPKGRVVSVKIGADGQVRRAFVKTVTGVYERPATKIAVLSVNKEVGPHTDIPGGSVKKIRQP